MPFAAEYNPSASAPFPWGLLLFAAGAFLLLGLFIALYRKHRPSVAPRLQDLLLAGGLTLVYAFIAFFNLGSCSTPQTYYKAERAGEGFCLDLGKPVPIAQLNYFLALEAGSFDIDFSQDYVTWGAPQTIRQEHRYSMIEWRTLAVNATARYIRVTAGQPGVMLGEIGVFAEGADQPAPASIVRAPGRQPPAADPAVVCDEPERVPLAPSFLNSMYFDETYHARTAFEYTLGRDASETTHPPLGKLTIAAGLRLFGFTPSGWRFMGTLAGVLMVPVMYAFGLALFKKRELAFAAAFLFAFDFMHFVQTRIATIDVFGVFWIILMYYFMYRAIQANPFAGKMRRFLLPVLLSGLCFGLGAASKWIALYGAIGLAFIFLGAYFIRLAVHIAAFIMARPGERPDADGDEDKEPPNPARSVGRFVRSVVLRPLLHVAVAAASFIVLPALIYLASYIPFMEARGPLHPEIKPIDLVIREQRFIFNYHATLQAEHPFSSPWYAWPVMARPIWYYSGQAHLPETQISSIAAFGNPAVWWPGIAAVAGLCAILIVLGVRAVIAIVRTLKRRKTDDGSEPSGPRASALLKKMVPGLFILIGLAAQYMPWIVIPRKLNFIYHFFASVPFIVFAIVYVLKIVLEKWPKARWVIFVWLGVTLALFLMFYPVLSGMTVDAWYVKYFLRWFPGWYF